MVPALVKIAVVFIIVVLLIRKKVSLASSFLAGSLLVALFFSLAPSETAGALIAGVSRPKTAALCVIIALILIFSNSMESCGQLRRLLTTFQGLIKSPRLNLSIFPALIGLLPMPGGAVFSAPMVKEIGNRTDLDGATLSYINYWFRHIWEYWWPMYPGILLATLLADINLPVFMAVMFPFTLVVARIGWIPVKPFSLRSTSRDQADKISPYPFLREISPILVVITAGVLTGSLLSVTFPGLVVAKEIGLTASLCIGLIMVWRMNGISWNQRRTFILSSNVFKMVYMVAMIMVFKEMLEKSGAVDSISSELVRLCIPLAGICIVLPFVIGLLTGITIAFVGSTFPILVSLVNAHGEAHYMILYLALALSCGFAGVLMSPVHLCLLMSNEYFGTSLKPVYRLLWRPCLSLAVCAVLYFLVLRWLASGYFML